MNKSLTRPKNVALKSDYLEKNIDTGFPISIKVGNSVIIFTDGETATWANGEKCEVSLGNLAYQLLGGSAVIVR